MGGQRQQLGHAGRGSDQADPRDPLLAVHGQDQTTRDRPSRGGARPRWSAPRHPASGPPAAAGRGARGARPRVHDFGPQLREQLELEGADLRQEAGVRHEVRIGLPHAADVLEQLASVGAQGHGEGHRRQIGSAPAQGRQLAVGPDALEAGHHRHQAVGHRGSQRAGVDPSDGRAQVSGRGPDSGLRPAERAGVETARLESEGEQGGGQRLAGGQRPIGLPRHRRIRRMRPVAAKRGSPIRQQHRRGGQDGVGHPFEGGDHDHRAQPLGPLADDDLDRGGDVLRAGEDRSAELVDHHRSAAHGADSRRPTAGSAVPSPGARFNLARVAAGRFATGSWPGMRPIIASCRFAAAANRGPCWWPKSCSSRRRRPASPNGSTPSWTDIPRRRPWPPRLRRRSWPIGAGSATTAAP